jgi:hypothetical protein
MDVETKLKEIYQEVGRNEFIKMLKILGFVIVDEKKLGRKIPIYKTTEEIKNHLSKIKKKRD